MVNCAKGATACKFSLALFQDRRNVFRARHNLARACLSEWRRRQKFLLQGVDSLLDIKRRVALPARIYIQFPVDPSNGGAHQPVVNHPPNRPAIRVQVFPPALEFGKIHALFGYCCGGPIAHSAGVLDAGNVVKGEGSVACAPGPEVGRQFVQRIRFRWC